MRLMQPPTKGEIPRITAGFYGPPGSGKTTLMGGFHGDTRTGPTLWLNCGGNPDMLIQQGQLGTVLNLETVEDLVKPLDYLLNGQHVQHPFYKEWHKKTDLDVHFNSLVIDTVSDVQGLLIDSLIGIKSDKLEQYSILNVATPDPKAHGKDIASKTLLMARQMLITLPLHVFLGFQQHETVVFEGEGKKIISGKLTTQLSLWGQSRMRVPAWLKLMGRMYWVKGMKNEEVQVGNRTSKRQVPDLYPVIRWIDDRSHVKNQLAQSLGQELKRPTAKLILDLIQQDYQKGAIT